MAGTPKMKDIKSPEEIEEGIKSTPTVTWDPFTVFPKEIYLMIFNLLERAEDKRNFMNAHMNWYHLFKSQSVLLLFEPVFKEVAREEYKLFNAYENCRLVCKDWDNGLQSYFQLHRCYFKIAEAGVGFEDIWSPNSNLRTLTIVSLGEPCNRLNLFSGADELLETFSVTHPPSKNPIFSRSITLRPFSEEEDVEEDIRLRTSVDALLEKYGHHIWHCKIEIEETLDPEVCICIGKWISLMPELKTLQLKYENADVEDESWMDLQEIEDAQVIQSEMKELIFLQSSYLPAIVFNKLVGNLPKLQLLQINIFKGEDSFLRNFELMIEREKLQEAFLTLKGYDFEHLQDSQPFPNLKKLSITLEFETEEERKNKAYSDWPDWEMIFGILEEKFPAVEELSLRLQKAMSKEDKLVAIHDSMECQLNLPRLKKLWVALPNLCSLDFLRPCKALQDLRVVLEHSEWYCKNSRILSGIRRYEKINFNMDLKMMWESNIWKAFPKLCRLTIWAWNEADYYGFDQYTYERNGEKKKYDMQINPENQSDEYSSDLDDFNEED